MAKEIMITIDPEGNTTVEAFGYTGPECLEATEAFEKILGASAGRQKKKEFYVQEQGKVVGKNHVKRNK